ncbi:MAG: cation diffusion facilitator family transporter [Bacillota bacterium]
METRNGGGIRVAKVSMVINLALVVLKGVFAVLSGSSALMADAAHSAGDILSTIPVLVGFSISSRPADSDHPYGHGRAEQLMTALLAGILLLTAYFIARDGVATIMAPARPAPGVTALGVAAVSVITKELMYRYAVAEGRRLGSDLLIADAWHHRSDAMSSVAALIGIGGANVGFPILDPLAALVVAVMLAWTGTTILRSAVHALMDGQPRDFTDEMERVREIATDISGIIHVDDVRIRRYGGQLIMDVEISVESTRTVGTAHDLATRLRDRLERANPHIGGVFIHVNPHPEHEPKRDGKI